MTEPENRLAQVPSAMAKAVARGLLLERAATYVVQAKIAGAIGIQERSLRAKFSADRGVTDNDLEHGARAVETVAFEMLALVAKMRGFVA